MQQLAEEWRSRVIHRSFLASPTLDETGLRQGYGTLILPTAGNGVFRLDQRGDDRLLTLLGVANGAELTAKILLQVATAVREWDREDKALAAIRLAFVPFRKLQGDEDAYRLFLAEKALDAGLPPWDLLEEVGLVALRPLLKFNPDQVRVPAGSGRASGQWTRDGTSNPPSPVRSRRTAEGAPVGTPDPPKIVPAFFDDRPASQRQDEVTRPLHILPGETPAHHAPADPLLREGAPFPFAVPLPRKDDEDGPACPAEQKDVPHPASQKAQDYEDLIHQLVNPTNPTKSGNAYFILNSETGKLVSFDDCKKSNEYSSIPNIRKGDVVEAKNAMFDFLMKQSWYRGDKSFDEQMEAQDAAVTAEGKGRHIFVCFGGEIAANIARRRLERKLRNTTFLQCGS